MTDRVYRDEKRIADTSFSTSIDWENFEIMVGVPDNISGKRALEIGSGGSNSIRRLRELGVEAYGIDPRYADLLRLRHSIEKHYKSPRVDRKLKGYIQRHEKNERIGYWEGVNESNRRALENMELFLSDPQPFYIAGLAGRLPFRDESFDNIFSFQCLTAFLAKEPLVFMGAMREVLRVLKPGGEIRIHPWYEVNNGMIEARSCAEFIQYCRAEGYRYRYETHKPLSSCLIATKAC